MGIFRGERGLGLPGRRGAVDKEEGVSGGAGSSAGGGAHGGGGAVRVTTVRRKRTTLTGRAQGAEREGKGAKGYGELGKLGRGKKRGGSGPSQACCLRSFSSFFFVLYFSLF